MTEEMSFQVLLENGQGFSIPDEGGKLIPPARNSEWKRSGEWCCASLWWHHEALLARRSQTSWGQGCKYGVCSICSAYGRHTEGAPLCQNKSLKFLFNEAFKIFETWRLLRDIFCWLESYKNTVSKKMFWKKTLNLFMHEFFFCFSANEITFLFSKYNHCNALYMSVHKKYFL